MSFPTFSPSVHLKEIRLRKKETAFVTFKVEKYRHIPSRGYFDSEQHCFENQNESHTIDCFKKCLIERIKVNNDLNFKVNILSNQCMNADRLPACHCQHFRLTCLRD